MYVIWLPNIAHLSVNSITMLFIEAISYSFLIILASVTNYYNVLFSNVIIHQYGNNINSCILSLGWIQIEPIKTIKEMNNRLYFWKEWDIQYRKYNTSWVLACFQNFEIFFAVIWCMLTWKRLWKVFIALYLILLWNRH